jgi:hypothetical protein
MMVETYEYNQASRVQTTLIVSWEKAIALRWLSEVIVKDHRSCMVVEQDYHLAQQAIIALFNDVDFGSQCGLAHQLTKSYYLSYFHKLYFTSLLLLLTLFTLLLTLFFLLTYNKTNFFFLILCHHLFFIINCVAK